MNDDGIIYLMVMGINGQLDSTYTQTHLHTINTHAEYVYRESSIGMKIGDLETAERRAWR